MRGVSELIREHNSFINGLHWTPAGLSYHLIQIRFLQQERLIHLVVMLFVAFCALSSLALFLHLDMVLFMISFALLLILTLFYVLHYYKLENTVIEWYFIYNDESKKENFSHER